MATHDIEKDPGIAEPNDHPSSKEDEVSEKPEIANIEDVERQKEQVEARLNRFTHEEEEAVIRKLDWHLMPLIFVLYSLSVLTDRIWEMRRSPGCRRILILLGIVMLGLERFSIFHVSVFLSKYGN